jgi:hypothetical protein
VLPPLPGPLGALLGTLLPPLPGLADEWLAPAELGCDDPLDGLPLDDMLPSPGGNSGEPLTEPLEPELELELELRLFEPLDPELPLFLIPLASSVRRNITPCGSSVASSPSPASGVRSVIAATNLFSVSPLRI